MKGSEPQVRSRVEIQPPRSAKLQLTLVNFILFRWVKLRAEWGIFEKYRICQRYLKHDRMKKVLRDQRHLKEVHSDTTLDFRYAQFLFTRGSVNMSCLIPRTREYSTSWVGGYITEAVCRVTHLAQQIYRPLKWSRVLINCNHKTGKLHVYG